MSPTKTVKFAMACAEHTFKYILQPRGFASHAKNPSSRRWLARQERDRFVKSAQVQNYRARSAFKLLEMDDRFKLLKPGMTVIDIGAAPGSWTQVALERVNAEPQDASKSQGSVISIDLQRIPPLPGATLFDFSDFTSPQIQQKIFAELDSKSADVVLSDMAPNATGMRELDHEKIVTLFETAWTFASRVLTENGHFVGKLWDGHHSGRLREELSPLFRSVRTVKPEASRQESSELFIFGRGFKRYLLHPKQT